MKAVALAVLISLAGCFTIGGGAGATIGASTYNDDVETEGEEISVAGAATLGILGGILVDCLLVFGVKWYPIGGSQD